MTDTQTNTAGRDNVFVCVCVCVCVRVSVCVLVCVSVYVCTRCHTHCTNVFEQRLTAGYWLINVVFECLCLILYVWVCVCVYARGSVCVIDRQGNSKGVGLVRGKETKRAMSLRKPSLEKV